MDDAQLYDRNPQRRASKLKTAKSLGMFGKAGEQHPDGKSGGHGPVVRTEVEKHKDKTAHVIAHHEDGHAAIHQHPHEQAAHEHAAKLMSGEGDGEHNLQPGDQAAEEQDMGLGGEDNGMDAGEQECPECGGKMEPDGQGGEKCERCGYTKDEDEATDNPKEEAAEAANG